MNSSNQKNPIFKKEKNKFIKKIMIFFFINKNNINLIKKFFTNKLIIIIFLSFILILSLFVEYFYYPKIKVCLCTIGKRENKYVIEFLEHYKNYKVDKIFLYDNNDINDERFEDIIYKYIKKKFVEIINVRGKTAIQMESINKCYKNNYKAYDWFIFYDMDEFIFLKNKKNIKYFLNNYIFNKCQVIQLNWVIHTDNNHLYYTKKSLKKRFPVRGKSLKKSIDIKSIIRGNIITNITSLHYLNPNLTACDGFGKIKEHHKFFIQKRDYTYYYIIHYYTKSTEEFIDKMKKGCVAHGEKRRFGLVSNYFEINQITLEKLNYIEKETSLNLSKYRMIIK